MYKNIIIILILIIPTRFFAQKTDHEFGVFAGVSYYMGDLNPRKVFHEIDPAIGLVYKLNLSSRYALRFSGIFGTLHGSDASSDNGYLQFLIYCY